MALANDTYPTSIRLTLIDIGGNTVTKEFLVPTSVWDPASDLLSALFTIRGNLVTALNAITDALILKSYITISQTDDTDTLGPTGSEVENLASIVCNTNVAGEKRTIQVVNPNEGIMVDTSGANYNVVDISDSALNTYLDLFQETGGSFYLVKGLFADDTTPMVSGKRIHRKSNKG